MNELDEIEEVIKKGHDITLEAGKEATLGMIKLTANQRTKSARQASIEHHALYMGIGTTFMDDIVPIIKKMNEGLQSTGVGKAEAHVLTALYIGKVFKLIIDAVNEEV